MPRASKGSDDEAPRKTSAGKTPARKTPARKTPARKTPARKTPARKPAASTDRSALEPVFQRLRAILAGYADRLALHQDEPGAYALYSRVIAPNKKPWFFGAAAVRAKAVSYHLFPIYTEPTLASAVSPELRRRQQGKSCFNLARIDEPLLAELAELTRRGFETYERLGRI